MRLPHQSQLRSYSLHFQVWASQKSLSQTTIHHFRAVSTDFVKANGIQHIKTVMYHPASSGLAERAVVKWITVRLSEQFSPQVPHDSDNNWCLTCRTADGL